MTANGGSRAGLRLGENSAVLWHSPTLLAFCVALVAVFIAPKVHMMHAASIYSSIGIMALATATAVAFSLRPPPSALAVLVPFLSLLAIGVFRVGTGGTVSLFTPLLLLPVVWIAAAPGRWYIALAVAGTSIALLMPYFLGVLSPAVPGAEEFWRAVFAPFVYGLGALTVNELSRRLRQQIARARESEWRLRLADQLTRSVLDAVTEQSVIGTDLDGLIDVWNPGAARLLGLSPGETQGRRHIGDFHLAEEIDARSESPAASPLSVLVAGAGPGMAAVREWTYVRADGGQVPVEVSATSRLGEDSEPIGYIFVASDLTRVQEAARVKDQFVGLITHELRTPVGSVLGYLDLLRDDPLTDDQQRYVQVAERNAKRLLHLVGDLLFTAQIEAGSFPIQPDRVDLSAVVEAAVESGTPAAVTAGVTLTAALPEATVFIRGDAVRLGQACDNLVSNAIKFTPAAGVVTVGLTFGGAVARISVRDTGIGIPPGELDQLFGRFFRASTAIRNAVPGVGLGLVVTKAIVTAHGGTIDVTSVEGVGTVFTMNLPAE
ncbi:MAG TPA: ATP-binding protein [Lacisediminihabitans sp.]|uniref:sensor histidine kinase n=1 Tax=Lacisediminihabitans sp. TaxID=2787631 RepID=UPI002EDB4F1A